MCNKPLYRVNALHLLKGFPKCFEKRVRNGALILSYEDKEYLKSTFGYGDNIFLAIPCGQCAGCRADYAKQWASRLMLEALYYERKCFITLTYSEENVPYEDVVNEQTGEIIRAKVLKKRDFQLFMKVMRKSLAKQGIKVRFFACGEYGSRTFRPHFHAILLGYDFPDKKFFYCEKNGRRYSYPVPNGTSYYVSDELLRFWGGRGHVLISEVTVASCKYVTNYCTKKLKKPKTEKDKEELRAKWWNIDGSSKYVTDRLRQVGAIQNEFATMSRRPGIGRRFFDEHLEEYNLYDEVKYPFSSKGLAKRLRYYDKLFESLLFADKFENGVAPPKFGLRFLERFRAWKEVRKLKAQAFERQYKSSLSERERLLQNEERMQAAFARSRLNRDF